MREIMLSRHFKNEMAILTSQILEFSPASLLATRKCPNEHAMHCETHSLLLSHFVNYIVVLTILQRHVIRHVHLC